METYPRISRNGEAALTVEFGDTIAPDVHARIVNLDTQLSASDIMGVVEALPTYRSLYVSYAPDIISFDALSEKLRALIPSETCSASTRSVEWTIPVCFDAPYGEDVSALSERCDLSPSEFIETFCATPLTVYMFGFAPGYAFMGKLPDALTFPRRETPRAPIAPGTLISAGGQASLATLPMPTGWYVLGRTPEKMWDADAVHPAPFLNVGDSVRFEPISEAAFDALSKRSNSGERLARKTVKL